MSLEDDLDRIRQLFQRMGAQQRQTVLEFAEFQQIRNPEPGADEGDVNPEEERPQPLEIPRPDEESVVMAIKRLSKTYPMLDKARLLNETSLLMSKHVMQGIPANEVIDELELLFSVHYRKHEEQQGQPQE